MTNEDYRGTQRELVPGTLRGFRQFRILRSSEDNKLFIRSPQQSFVWNEPLEWKRAYCSKNLSVWDSTCLSCSPFHKNPFLSFFHRNIIESVCDIAYEYCYHYELLSKGLRRECAAKIRYLEKDRQHTPNHACRCGFYACYNLLLLAEASGISWSNHGNNFDLAIGVVEASGRIQLGTQGFQAEKMRLVSMYVDSFYKYPIADQVWLRENANAHQDFSKLIREYPPDDVSKLGIKVGSSSLPNIFQIKGVLPNRLLELLGLVKGKTVRVVDAES